MITGDGDFLEKEERGREKNIRIVVEIDFLNERGDMTHGSLCGGVLSVSSLPAWLVDLMSLSRQ